MRLLLTVVVMAGTLASLLAQSYDDVFNNARALLKQQRYGEAATEGRKAIALDRSRWQGYYITATAYSGMNQCDAALPYFQSALDRSVPEQLKMTIDGAVAECERLLRAPVASGSRSPQSPSQVASASPSQSFGLPGDFEAYHWHRISVGAAMSQFAASDAHFEPGQLHLDHYSISFGEGPKKKHGHVFQCGQFTTQQGAEGLEISDSKMTVRVNVADDNLQRLMNALGSACRSQ